MGGRVAFAVMLAGCRIHFDDVPADAVVVAIDAPVTLANHDEDGDGRDDAIDNCPHVANVDQQNSDGDGVGDACDPSGTTTETIAFFDPFTSLLPMWSKYGTNTAVVDGETLSSDTRAGPMRYGYNVVAQTDLFELAGTLRAQGAANEQIAVTVYESATAVYYCELYETSPPPKFGATYTLDGTTYVPLEEVTAAGTLANADFMLRLSATPTTVRCDTSWPAASQTVTGVIPTAIDTPVRLHIATAGIDVSWHYFIQIHTTP